MFTKHETLNPALIQFLQAVESRLSKHEQTLPNDRFEQIDRLAAYIREKAAHHAQLRLMFICTHNSRRSVLGQAVAPLLAYALGMPVPESYSGGTEVTACHENSLLALEALGMEVNRGTELNNPESNLVPYPTAASIAIWSKTYNDARNPDADFAAIMVCSSADENCPFVAGADTRISLPFEDPKRSDGTPEALDVYKETAITIATDLALAFRLAAVS